MLCCCSSCYKALHICCFNACHYYRLVFTVADVSVVITDAVVVVVLLMLAVVILDVVTV